MSRIIIFAGPTLHHELIRTLIPSSEIHPPIAAGDLIRLAPTKGDIVVIIDGFFYQSASVRHKEILYLLKRGVHVWGAASMGALRAAELATFGMRGFGQIFEAYVSGQIEGDDEVTILHAPEDMGYTPLTEALVNIRYACKLAVEAHVLSDGASETIISIAAALPFHERSYQNILARCSLPLQERNSLQNFLKQEEPNLKKIDALEMLYALQSAYPLNNENASFELHETSRVQSWHFSEKGEHVNDDQWIFDSEVLTAYQLFSKSYPETHYQLLLSALAGLATQSLPQETFSSCVDCVESAAQYIAMRCSIHLEEQFPATMQHWLYPEEKLLSQQQQIVKFAIRLWHDPRGFDWRPVITQQLRARSLFYRWQKLVVAARTLNHAIWGQNATARCYALHTDVVSAWFRQRWGVEEKNFELAILDRGFKDITDFFDRACFFYMFDRYIGVEKVETVSFFS